MRFCFCVFVEMWEYAFVKSVFNIYETVYQEIKRKRCKRTEVQTYRSTKVLKYECTFHFRDSL
nr:MAG TPA: hypothetical protein [Caudoviricetes sp.]